MLNRETEERLRLAQTEGQKLKEQKAATAEQTRVAAVQKKEAELAQKQDLENERLKFQTRLVERAERLLNAFNVVVYESKGRIEISTVDSSSSWLAHISLVVEAGEKQINDGDGGTMTTQAFDRIKVLAQVDGTVSVEWSVRWKSGWSQGYKVEGKTGYLAQTYKTRFLVRTPIHDPRLVAERARFHLDHPDFEKVLEDTLAEIALAYAAE
jgi:hypothetical protein